MTKMRLLILFLGFVGEHLAGGELQAHAALVDSIPMYVFIDNSVLDLKRNLPI